MNQEHRQQLLTLLTLFGISSMEPIDLEGLNRDEAGDQRFLVALFILGAVDFVHQAEELTYGEFRHLAIDVLTSLGWPKEAASSIVDMASTLPKWGDTRVEYGEESMIAGANAFRDFYVNKDTTAPLELLTLVKAKWKDIDLGGPPPSSSQLQCDGNETPELSAPQVSQESSNTKERLAVMVDPEMQFPSHDRAPNKTKTDELPFVDIGWNIGVLSNGTPFRVECWAEDNITMLTFFIPVAGAKGADPTPFEKPLEDEDLISLLCQGSQNIYFERLLEEEGLISFLSEKRHVSARPFKDYAGVDVWSVNVIVGDEDTLYTDDRVPLRPWKKD